MKKFLIALLAVLLCLTFVACGPTPDETTTDNGGDDTTLEGGDDTTLEGGDSTTPEGTDPAETTEPEVVDTDTLAVGEDNNTEFGPINQ